MSDVPTARAIEACAAVSGGPPLPDDIDVTINFHPDAVSGGRMVIERMADEGVYRSQFETQLSNGGLTAFRGGDRWAWESRMFGGAYDDAPPELRPKYGALNLRRKATGGSPRFGSCHLRIARSKRPNLTFCYPDSHLEPTLFGTSERFGLIAPAQENAAKLEPLDDYVEAHVHGVIDIRCDVEAVVLDPSFADTTVHRAADALGIAVDWHSGFVADRDPLERFAVYRGRAVAEFIERSFEIGPIRPSDFSALRASTAAPDLVKKSWHCVARYGDPDLRKTAIGSLGLTDPA